MPVSAKRSFVGAVLTTVLLVGLLMFVIFISMWVKRDEELRVEGYKNGYNTFTSITDKEKHRRKSGKHSHTTYYKYFVEIDGKKIDLGSAPSGESFEIGDTVAVLVYNGNAWFSIDYYNLKEPTVGMYRIFYILAVPCVLVMLWLLISSEWKIHIHQKYGKLVVGRVVSFSREGGKNKYWSVNFDVGEPHLVNIHTTEAKFFDKGTLVHLRHYKGSYYLNYE